MLEAQNTPKKSVIAVRVGSALRHAEFALNTPFHVPTGGIIDSQDPQINVSLYEKLGTSTIADADESESICNVPVRTPNGVCTQVTLRIRRGQTQSIAEAKRTQAGVEDYLDKHQLEARLQGLFEIVLKKQPQNPYRCMIEELRKCRTPDEEGLHCTLAAQVPKAPVAPTEPAPRNARPSPAAKARNIKPAEGAGQKMQEEADTKAALAQFSSYNEGSTSSSAAQGQARRQGDDVAASSEERAHNVKVASAVVTDVFKAAHARNEARSLGLNTGTGWAEAPATAESLQKAENRDLGMSVLKDTFKRVSEMQD